jgi:hypothetical protein
MPAPGFGVGNLMRASPMLGEQLFVIESTRAVRTRAYSSSTAIPATDCTPDCAADELAALALCAAWSVMASENRAIDASLSAKTGFDSAASTMAQVSENPLRKRTVQGESTSRPMNRAPTGAYRDKSARLLHLYRGGRPMSATLNGVVQVKVPKAAATAETGDAAGQESIATSAPSRIVDCLRPNAILPGSLVVTFPRSSSPSLPRAGRRSSRSDTPVHPLAA